MTLCPPCEQAPMRSRSHVASSNRGETDENRCHDAQATAALIADSARLSWPIGSRAFGEPICVRLSQRRREHDRLRHRSAPARDRRDEPSLRGWVQPRRRRGRGTAVLHPGCPHPAARSRDRAGPGQDRRVLGCGRGGAADGRPAGAAVYARSAAARRLGIHDRTRHAHPCGRPAGDAEVRRAVEAGGRRLAPARGHLEHGHSLSTMVSVDTIVPLFKSRRKLNMSNTTKVCMTIAALALSLGTAPAPAAGPTDPVKNIVLVHGAFADGSSWAKVIAILQAKGYNVTAVQNPLTSLADDVAATNRALAAQKGPVILVGHSWAGAVITGAGVDPKVAGLVYVAAFAPDADEVIGDLGKNYPAPPTFAAPIVDPQGFMSLSTEAMVKHFAWDLPPAEARVVAATQTPIATSAFGAKVSNVAWKTKPSWYIVAGKDQAIAPDEERFFAKRMKATTKELDTSHVPMLSKPKEVAAVIMEAAAKAAH